MAKKLDSIIRSFDWQAAEEWLKERSENTDALKPAESTPELDLLRWIKRSDRFILKHATNEERQKKREFINNFIDYCKIDHLRPLVQNEIEALMVFDRLYLLLIEYLKDNDIYKLDVCSILSRSMNYIIGEYTSLLKMCKSKAQSSDQIFFAGPYVDDTESGRSLSADVISDNLCDSFVSIIKMLAHVYDLIDKGTKEIILPEAIFVPDKPEDCPETLFSFIRLCVVWNLLDEINERFRHLGGTFAMMFNDLLVDTHNFTSVVINYRPKPEGSFSYYDSIANHRLKRMEEEYLGQCLINDEIMNANTGNYGNQEKLPPEAYLSSMEMVTVQFLATIFCLDVLEDKTLTNGLEIKEIIRGYCVLHEFADALESSSDSPGLVCRIFTFEELKALFLKNGLSEQSSEKFISLMTFKISSPDLFDAPLLKTAEGRYALFLPALFFGSPPMIIASILSSHLDLSKKGGAFEKDMLQFFQENGLYPQSPKFTRDNEDYEYDIVFEWDDHVFIIECKNSFLSRNRPAYAAQFRERMDEAVAQVLRLVHGAQKYHDTFLERTGISLEGKTVVPCILNCLPYWEPQREGVSFMDSSFVKRFFKRKAFGGVAINQGELSLLAPAYSWWKGDKPSLEDFLIQLKLPVQVKIWQDHIGLEHTPVSYTTLMTLVMDKWAARPLTAESVVKSFGVSPGALVSGRRQDPRRKTGKKGKKSGKSRK